MKVPPNPQAPAGYFYSALLKYKGHLGRRSKRGAPAKSRAIRVKRRSAGRRFIPLLRYTLGDVRRTGDQLHHGGVWDPIFIFQESTGSSHARCPWHISVCCGSHQASDGTWRCALPTSPRLHRARNICEGIHQQFVDMPRNHICFLKDLLCRQPVCWRIEIDPPEEWKY